MIKRIAIYMPSLGGGGAERAMMDISRGFADRGVSVDMALVKSEGPYIELMDERVRLIDFKARRTVASLPRLIRYISRERPDALISTLPETNVVALFAKKFFVKKVPVVARRANNFSMEYANAKPKDRAVLRLERSLLPSANAVVVNSRGVADDLSETVPGVSGLISVAHNPIVWPDHAQSSDAGVDHPWFSGGGPPVILAAGRLVETKGHADLIRAFSEVLTRREARLVVLGEGPERSGLLRLARRLDVAQAVDFPGFHLNPFAYMAKASVFVLSSAYEGFPNVLVQAMACGTPVVSTDCPSGPNEALMGGKLGRLAPVGDVRALADAITQTLDNPIKPSLLVERARAYSAQASIDRYMEIVSKC